MNKINRKIIFGTALTGAAAIALGVFAATENSTSQLYLYPLLTKHRSL